MHHPESAMNETVQAGCQALLADTLALMTDYAQIRPDAPHRHLLAGQVAHSLGALATQPCFSPRMRAALMQLAGEWVALAPLADEAPASKASALWHRTAARVQ